MNRLIKVKHLPIPRLPTTTPAWKKPIVEYPKDARILTFIHEPPEPKKPTRRKKAKPKPEPNNKRKKEVHHYCGPWLEEQDQVVIKMYNEGKSLFEISEKAGHTAGAITARICKLKKEKRITISRHYACWTNEQKETVLKMRAEGTTFKEIGKALGRSETATYRIYKKMIQGGDGNESRAQNADD